MLTRTQQASREGRPRLFRQRDFAVYWAGGLASSMGTWLQNVTASVVILGITHSAFLVGVLNFATFAPVFVLSIPGGMVSDRFNRRTVVILTQLFSFVVAAVMTALSAAGHLSAAMLVCLSLLLGASYAVTKPAMSAILPSLVRRDEVARANAINTLQFSIGQLGGGALATAVLAFASPTWAFGANAASFLAPVASMLALRKTLSGAPNTAARRLRGTGMEGLRYAVRTRAIGAMLAAVALSGSSLEVLRTLAPTLVSREMHVSADRAGLLITSYGIGWLAGLLTFSPISRRTPPTHLLAAAFALQTVGMLGLAISRTVSAGAVLAATIGLGFAFTIPALSAGLQQMSPAHLLGRVMALFSMCMIGVRPIFSLTAGALASVGSSSLACAICAVFPLLALRLVVVTGEALRDARENRPESSYDAAPS